MRISDWSSDVRSSDLGAAEVGANDARNLGGIEQRRPRGCDLVLEGLGVIEGADHVAQAAEGGTLVGGDMVADAGLEGMQCGTAQKIGSASCRERVCQYV